MTEYLIYPVSKKPISLGAKEPRSRIVGGSVRRHTCKGGVVGSRLINMPFDVFRETANNMDLGSSVNLIHILEGLPKSPDIQQKIDYMEQIKNKRLAPDFSRFIESVNNEIGVIETDLLSRKLNSVEMIDNALASLDVRIPNILAYYESNITDREGLIDLRVIRKRLAVLNRMLNETRQYYVNNPPSSCVMC